MPHTAKTSNKKPKEAWSDFERRVMISLICKGLHKPYNLERLAFEFNEARNCGRAQSPKAWSPEKVWDLYKSVDGRDRDTLRLERRVGAGRITRKQRLALERGLATSNDGRRERERKWRQKRLWIAERTGHGERRRGAWLFLEEGASFLPVLPVYGLFSTMRR